MGFHDIFAYPVYKKVYLHHGWLGVMNYAFMFFIVSYVVLFPMLYSKEYLDCFTVNSQIIFGSPGRPKGVESSVCQELGAPRETGIALNGMYFQSGCLINHTVPAQCLPVDPATQVLASIPGYMSIKLREINIPLLTYSKALTDRQCQELLQDLYQDTESCNSLYAVNRTILQADLVDSIHFDADILNTIVPLTFVLDPSQAHLLKDTQLCGMHLPNSSAVTATCADASDLIIQGESCAQPSTNTNQSLTYRVTLGTIAASIVGLNHNGQGKNIAHKLKPHPNHLMALCQSRLNISVSAEEWDALLASESGLQDLWGLDHQLISSLRSDAVLNNATTYGAYQEFASTLCRLEETKGRLQSLLLNSEVSITATFDNTRQSKGSFNGPYSPVIPNIRLASEIIFSGSPIVTEQSMATNQLREFQVSGLKEAAEEFMAANPGENITEISSRVTTLKFGLQMTAHAGGSVCTINATYAVLILLQAITMVTAATSIMVILISYVLPHKVDYASYFKEHGYSFDGENWFTSCFMRRQRGGRMNVAKQACTNRESTLNFHASENDIKSSISGIKDRNHQSLAKWAVGSLEAEIQTSL